MQTLHPARGWLIPTIVAAILFMGAVASNLVATYVQTSLDPYRRWVWVSFGIALIVAIAVAIRKANRAAHSSNPHIKSQTEGEPGEAVGLVDTHYKAANRHEVAPIPTATALHQLPPPVSDFTGRADELAELTTMLEQGGISISGLHGLGGIGKTALALKLADQLKPRYLDAQFYLDLKGASAEPLAVTEALAHVIRAYHPTAKLPDTEAGLLGLYRSVLQGQRALLLMDNAASAEQIEPLIPPVGCVLLVTSRRHFTVPGLFAKNLEALSPEDASQLVVSIAPRTGGLADEIAKLCGYLPLALRLAGSALVTFVNLAPADYARRLQDGQRRLELIDASLNLSYELMNQELRKHWRLLAVFPDTFQEPAVAVVWNLDADKAQDILGELIATSMVEWNETTRRYNLHDLARLFAGSRLTTDEKADGQARHATHYQAVMAAANEPYLKGAETVGSGVLFDLEWRNIEAGQAWAAAEAEQNDQAAQLAIAYPIAGAHVLNLRQHPRDQIRWLKMAVYASRRLKQRRNEGAALGNLGLAYGDLGETRRAIEFHEQALLIARELGSRKGEGVNLGNLGVAYKNLGETRRAIEFYEQRLAIARELGDRRGEGTALNNLGNAYAALGETRRAIEFYEQRLEMARGIGDRRGEGTVLGNMGRAYANLGETSRAVEFYEKVLNIARDLGDRKLEGSVFWNMSLALDGLGERAQAIASVEEALMIFEQIEDLNAGKVRAQLAKWRGRE